MRIQIGIADAIGRYTIETFETEKEGRQFIDELKKKGYQEWSYGVILPPLSYMIRNSHELKESKGGAMSKHTPGEWRLAEFLKGRKGMLHRIHNEHGITIADIPCDPTDSEEGHRANARLIALSPKMLDALEDLVEVDDLWTDDDELITVLRAFHVVVEKCKPIIRKARGG